MKRLIFIIGCVLATGNNANQGSEKKDDDAGFSRFLYQRYENELYENRLYRAEMHRTKKDTNTEDFDKDQWVAFNPYKYPGPSNPNVVSPMKQANNKKDEKED